LLNMKRKICLLLNTTWNAYNFRKGLIRHFIDNGDEVVVIAPKDEYVEKIKALGVQHRSVDLQSSGLNPTKDLQYLRQLKKILRDEQPDILLGFTIKPNIYGSLAAGSLKLPISTNVSGLGTTFLWKGWIKKAATALYNRAFKKATHVFFQNADDRSLFLDHVRIPKSKTGLLPGSGIDLSAFEPQAGTGNQKVTFLMVSRLIIEKGIMEYVEAAEILNSYSDRVAFQLLGKYEPEHRRSITGPDMNRLEKSVEYLGQCDDVQNVISGADVVVLPSYREGTPRTLLEAGALARPIIATDVPGCREVVSDGENGFLCKDRDAGSLAGKMKLMLSLSEEERLQMGQFSRKWVEDHFDEKIVIGLYERKIQQLLS